MFSFSFIFCAPLRFLSGIESVLLFKVILRFFFLFCFCLLRAVAKRVSDRSLGSNGRVWRLGCIGAALLAISGRNYGSGGRCGALLQVGLLLCLQFVSDWWRGFLGLLRGVDVLIAIVLAIEFLVRMIGMDLGLRIGTEIRIECGACKNNEEQQELTFSDGRALTA